MSDQKSDTVFEKSLPVTETVRGAKLTKLANRASRQRAHLIGVEVTGEDIERAVPAQSHSCMIADAIKRKYPKFKNVLVDIQTIRWTDVEKQRRVMCLTPMLAQSKLAAFDFGTKPAPFKFDLHSSQVTSMKITRNKIDASGQVVMKRAKSRVRRADGSVKEYAYQKPQREIVSMPSYVKEFVNNDPRMRPSHDHVIGGAMPPVNRASRQRKFGMRAFTWADGEEPEVIAERQQRAYGWTDEQMAAEGWQFAKDRLAVKAAGERSEP